MNILHTEFGCTIPAGELPALGTIMVFDPSEIYLAERILAGFIDAWDDEDKDAFYYQLLRIQRRMQANMPEATN